MATPVLVIDDDVAIAGILADTLTEEGYVVEAATSRQEALARLTCAGRELHPHQSDPSEQVADHPAGLSSGHLG